MSSNEQQEVVSTKMEPTTAAAQEAVAYWRVAFRMYRDDPELCVLFVGGQEAPTLDSIGVSPRPIELIGVEPRFVKQHRWDRYGERCLDCGDKDRMNDPVCRPRMADPSIEATPSIAVDPSTEVSPMTDAPVAAAPVDDVQLALIGRRHFNGPAPQAWYAAARDLLASTPEAPGIDLRVRELLARRLRQWRTHLPADPAKPGTRAIRTYYHPGLEGETDYNNDVAIWREACSVLDEALTLIDASSNGGDARNARRYIWLRNALASDDVRALEILVAQDKPDTADDFDAAIDAAMQPTSHGAGVSNG